jgi:transcriptional regulator with XRE-family HTH domain
MSNKSAAKLVKDARVSKGLTQTELAKKTSVHSNTIAKIEQGIQQPSYPTIKKLSKVLDIRHQRLPRVASLSSLVKCIICQARLSEIRSAHDLTTIALR